MTAPAEPEGGRPTARDVADLMGEYRRMLADAGGWTTRIPADRLARWERDKHNLLARIEAHTRGLGGGDEVEGPSL